MVLKIGLQKRAKLSAVKKVIWGAFAFWVSQLARW